MSKKLTISIIFLLLAPVLLKAQMINSKGETVLSARVEGKDTIPQAYLKQVIIYDLDMIGMSDREKRKYKKDLTRRRNAYSRLRLNVYKTYPYAVLAGFAIHDIDSAMLTLRSKEAKALYKKRKENELTKEYKGKLENLTMSQGKVLVILIARETGKPCYSIIKDLKGGFNARIWQTLATLFSNNLKRDYDPSGEDAMIEMICREIEASGKYVRKNN